MRNFKYLFLFDEILCATNFQEQSADQMWPLPQDTELDIPVLPSFEILQIKSRIVKCFQVFLFSIADCVCRPQHPWYPLGFPSAQIAGPTLSDQRQVPAGLAFLAFMYFVFLFVSIMLFVLFYCCKYFMLVPSFKILYY